MTLLSLYQAAEPLLSAAGTVVIAASAAVAATPTPNPNTLLGRLYKGLEFAALVIGKAKDTGLTQAIAAGDVKAIAADGVATLQQVAGSPGVTVPTPVTPTKA